jgi:hypothetical protein
MGTERGREVKILINGIIYDSTETPILIEFDENEQELFNGMKRFVSAPQDTTVEEKQKLIESVIFTNSK